jgi:Xaa-Pro aminopeptidase
VHYRATRESNRRIAPDILYLVDSGGQYWDGTTDVTRTVAIGTPSPEQRDRFTRVLKGHIALGLARFPAGTTGSQLDALAHRAVGGGARLTTAPPRRRLLNSSGPRGPHRISRCPTPCRCRRDDRLEQPATTRPANTASV